MNIKPFKKYWQDKGEILYTISPEHIDKTKVGQTTFTFLTACGLPYNIAPSLSFSELKRNSLLSPNQIFKIEFEELTKYLMFGSNGSGDPICIDLNNNNEIVYLNHDNYFERIFINNDILKFASCVIAYDDFIRMLINQGSSGYSRRKFSDGEYSDLKRKFLHIDKKCLQENSF